MLLNCALLFCTFQFSEKHLNNKIEKTTQMGLTHLSHVCDQENGQFHLDKWVTWSTPWRTKATAFLYTNAGVSGKILKKISFVIATKRIKYLGIILTKDVKNYILKTTKHYWRDWKDTMKWKDILCSLIGRINIVKMATWAKAIYRFNAIPIKIPMQFLKE